MRRMLLVLAVVLVMATFVVSVVPVFASVRGGTEYVNGLHGQGGGMGGGGGNATHNPHTPPPPPPPCCP